MIDATASPLLRSLALCCLTLLALPAQAQCPGKDDLCATSSPWLTANVVDVTITQPAERYRSHLTLTIIDPLNLVIDEDNTLGSQTQTGTIRLVEGSAMLSRGLVLQKGVETDALDAPVLMYQMLISLLTQAIPAGPAKFTGTHNISLTERKKSIRIATRSAGGSLPAPWQLSGSVTRKDAESISFRLSTTYTRGTAPATINMEGSWKKLATQPAADPAMPLAGWQLYPLGPLPVRQEQDSILDTSTTPPVPVRTLGELQQLIRNRPNARQGAGKPEQ